MATVPNGLLDMPDEGKNRGELLFIEHLLYIHAALSTFTYTLNLILTVLLKNLFFIDDETEA